MTFGNYLLNVRPGVLIETLSHIWGKLNLPTLLFRVGIINPSKYRFHDITRQMVPLPPPFIIMITKPTTPLTITTSKNNREGGTPFV